MKRILLLLFLPTYCFGQPTIEQNSIGLAYVIGYEGIEGSDILIDIAFPKAYLISESDDIDNLEFKQSANLKIYNVSRSYLIVDTTATFDFKMEFWCDNDSGTQYRPTAHLKMDHDGILGDYIIDYELQDLLGFAVVDLNQEIKYVKLGANQPRITLITTSAAEPVAMVWTTPDDAQNCDGLPDNNLIVFLQTAKGNFSMRCCGP